MQVSESCKLLCGTTTTLESTSQCQLAGLNRMHGLRHRYAQSRYETLTGWKAPAAGGPLTSLLSPRQRVSDSVARQIISHELGHERPQITAVYLGR